MIYDYRQKLSDFASKIHNVFGLQEQGGELITLVTRAVGCNHACLLFLDVDGQDFTTPFCEPKSEDNPLSNLRLSRKNPIVKHLRRERKLLTKDNAATLPDLGTLWVRDAGDIKLDEIELFMPLISRNRLIGILILGKSQSNRYSLEDLSLLDDVAD